MREKRNGVRKRGRERVSLQALRVRRGRARESRGGGDWPLQQGASDKGLEVAAQKPVVIRLATLSDAWHGW